MRLPKIVLLTTALSFTAFGNALRRPAALPRAGQPGALREHPERARPTAARPSQNSVGGAANSGLVAPSGTPNQMAPTPSQRVQPASPNGSPSPTNPQ